MGYRKQPDVARPSAYFTMDNYGESRERERERERESAGRESKSRQRARSMKVDGWDGGVETIAVNPSVGA